jgi:hypothetical protein
LELSSDESGAKDIEALHVEGIMDSLQDLMSVANMHENGIRKIKVEL